MKLKILRYVGMTCGAVIAGVVLMLTATKVVYPAISSMVGLAVAQTSTLWNNVKDGAVGDNVTSGILYTTLGMWDGTNFDRLRGSITNGILVDVTRISGSITPADGYANPTTANQVWSLGGIFNNTTWDRWRGQVVPVQGITLLNDSLSGAADTALTVTLTGVASTRIHIYKVVARCSPAGNSSFSITDGANSLGGMFVPSAPLQISEEWSTGLTMTTGLDAIINIPSCGVGNTAVLAYQADQF